MTDKILIVGGVGGGATAASQMRRFDENAEIILFDKGDYISFSNCGMPYYIGPFIEKRDQILFPEDKFSEKYNVDVRTGSEVTGINRENKTITYQNRAGTHTEDYDVLILSPGASAGFPDIKGVDNSRTFLLHTIPDMDKINQYIEKHKPKSATVTGAGFVGLEMLENLHASGLDCTMINRSDRIFKAVDPDMAEVIPQHLEDKGVALHLADGVDYFSDDGQIVHLKSGRQIESDMNIMAVGIRPNTNLLESAGLEIGVTGGVKVNEFMQTSDESIYCLGDAAETKSFVTGEAVNIHLAPPAHRQAYVLSSHIAGRATAYQGTLGTSMIKLFDLTMGAAGRNSTALENAGIEYEAVTTKGKSHAGYYPGAETLWLKVLFSPEDGTMLGAQAIGFDGVDKRLAVLATAIQAGMKVYELAALEVGYAPPYSRPKDPVNILGYKTAEMFEQQLKSL